MIPQIFHSPFMYITVLLVSIAGLVGIDYIKKLALFDDKVATLKTIGLTVVIFLCIDIIGIKKSIFSTNQEFVSGLFIYTPNLPIEELLFLTLLCYSTLVLYTAASHYFGGKQAKQTAGGKK